MTQMRKIPDEETRKRSVERLRECNRQLDLLNLQLEELIAIVEADLRRQKRERLEKRAKRVERTASEQV